MRSSRLGTTSLLLTHLQQCNLDHFRSSSRTCTAFRCHLCLFSVSTTDWMHVLYPPLNEITVAPYELTRAEAPDELVRVNTGIGKRVGSSKGLRRRVDDKIRILRTDYSLLDILLLLVSVMRFLTCLSALLLPLAACQTSSGEDARTSKFRNLAAKNGGIISLTSSMYDEITASTASSPRKYSVSVILTALNPKFGCTPCQAFDPQHKAVAKQWTVKNKSNKLGTHFFAVLDFEAGQDVFRRLGLNSAPVGQLFLPNNPQAVPYDLQITLMICVSTANWLE